MMIFDKAQRVTENGLIAFQGMCISIGDKFDIQDIGKYIKAALEQPEEDSGKLACGIISDLSNAKGESFNPYLVWFVPCLHNILQN